MSFTKGSINEVKNLIQTVKRDTTEISNLLQNKVQTNVIDQLANSLFTEEGYNYIKGFASNLEELSSELAIGANETIENIAQAYDSWLRRAKNSDDEDEAEAAKSMSSIFFNSSSSSKWTIAKTKEVQSISYKYTTGGDSREYSYLSSRETKITLNTSDVYPVTQDSEMKTGADTDALENIIENISLLKEDIKTKIHDYQNSLRGSASGIGSESNMTSAVEGYYSNMISSIDGIFDYLSSGKDNSTGMSTKIKELIEKYKSITKDVSDQLEQEASEII